MYQAKRAEARKARPLQKCIECRSTIPWSQPAPPYLVNHACQLQPERGMKHITQPLSPSTCQNHNLNIQLGTTQVVSGSSLCQMSKASK